MLPGRTTAAAVEAIIETDVNIDLTPFIDAANEIVTEQLSSAKLGLSDTRLEMIERWLTAHFYALRDPRAVSETASGIGATYQHKEDLLLASTAYGQHAMVLDTSGTLAVTNKLMIEGKYRRRIGVVWLGQRRGAPHVDNGFQPISSVGGN